MGSDRSDVPLDVDEHLHQLHVHDESRHSGGVSWEVRATMRGRVRGGCALRGACGDGSPLKPPVEHAREFCVLGEILGHEKPGSERVGKDVVVERPPKRS